MSIILLIIAIIYIILITYTWHSLGSIEKNKKIIYIIAGLFLMFLITTIVFNISKIGVNYVEINKEMEKMVGNMLVLIFTSLNGLVIMPMVGRVLNKQNENDIDKEVLTKKIVIILIILALITIFECNYMKYSQKNILEIYSSSLNI